MDFTKLDTVVAEAEKAETITVLQRNGEPYLGPDGKPCTISFVGRESKRGITTRDLILRRMRKLGKQGDTPKAWLQNRVDQVAGLVVDWSGWTYDDEPIPASIEHVRTLLTTLEHVLIQLEGAIAEHGSSDFFSASSTPTSTT